MRTFTIMDTKDGNNSFTVKCNTPGDAAINALDQLGWGRFKEEYSSINMVFRVIDNETNEVLLDTDSISKLIEYIDRNSDEYKVKDLAIQANERK